MDFPLPITPESVGIMIATGILGEIGPSPPSGFSLVVDEMGRFLVDESNLYLITES